MKKIIVLILLFNITAVFAGDVSRKGTTGADQLFIPVGARSIATSGAFVASVMGTESIYYNPAGLNRSNSSEAMFSYMNYIADINVSYIGVAGYLGDLGSIGFFMKTFDIGDIPQTTINDPDGNGVFYSPSLYTFGVTYSKLVTDRVSVGVNLKMINESIMSTSTTGFAIDFGVQYAFSKDFHIGVVVNNVGGNMKYDGQDLQVKTSLPGSYPGSVPAAYTAVTEEFQIPSYYELSLAYKFNLDAANGLALGGVFRNNNNLEDEMRFGLEYDYSRMFYLRAGYSLMMENSDQSIYTYTVGAGINMKLMDALNARFDYAFRPVNEFPTDNHVFTLMLGVN
ncbi:MAG: PorV/PorQ family protein [Bacteroidetes bacterium]|nr:PorV/PorQ family protein [Bacteroidota bacterium]MBU1115969.1 PorV/PorQ family protein [Bacteroidota bacterium]MBU1798434.1 PorV/PorQ family protein [Bacteroidota bacterium]